MVERFHTAIADAFAGAEAAVEDAIESRGPRVLNYLMRPELRDEAIWRRAFAAAEAGGVGLNPDDWADDFAELFDVPRGARNIGWQVVVTAFIAAACAQYDAEDVLPALWEALEVGNVEVMREAAVLARPLSREAKRGPSRAMMTAAKERLLAARHKGADDAG